MKNSVAIFSGRVFDASFLTYVFASTSCLFATGVPSTLFLLAFVSGCAVGFSGSKMSLLLPEKLGLLLLILLAVSSLWGHASFSQVVERWFEYRIFFVAPVFAWALINRKHLLQYAVVIGFCGSFVALLASWGLGLGILSVEGATNSLANRIFHGFLMSTVLALCLARWTIAQNFYEKLGLVAVSILCIVNVLFIETGRTGFLQIAAVGVVFFFVVLSPTQKIISIVVSLSVILVSFLLDLSLAEEINKTRTNFYEYAHGVNIETSLGLRMEFYRVATKIWLESPWVGVGVGSVELLIDAAYNSGDLKFPTDNLHSEFFNVLTSTGILGLLVYASIIVSWMTIGFRCEESVRAVTFFLLMLGVIWIASSLFNSTIRDWGEKNLLTIVLCLASSLLKIEKLKKDGE